MQETLGVFMIIYPITNCPFCNLPLSFQNTQNKSCLNQPGNHYFYIATDRFYLYYNNSQIGFDQNKFYLLLYSGEYSRHIIPAFEIKDIKKTLEKYLDLRIYS